MAFRVNESIDSGFEQAMRCLVELNADMFTAEEKVRAARCVRDLVNEVGPVVDHYPIWHPLVNHGIRSLNSAQTWPSQTHGYPILDHTVYFAHGFVTCPWVDSAAEDYQKAVEKMSRNSPIKIHARRIEEPLYAPGAVPVLVWCDLADLTRRHDFFIPTPVAIDLWLALVSRVMIRKQCHRTWDQMRYDFLGEPCGPRSSVFVSQETGQAMKTIYTTMEKYGVFGNPKSVAEPVDYFSDLPADL